MDKRSNREKVGLGIIIQRLGLSQLGYQLNIEGNKFSSKSRLTVFYNELDIVPVPTNFAMMQTAHIKSFDGILVSTDLESTNSALRVPTSYPKFFYVWNLEWVYSQYLYDYVSKTYLNSDIDLIARSQSHANVLARYWKEPKYVINDFNHEAFLDLVARESQRI